MTGGDTAFLQHEIAIEKLIVHNIIKCFIYAPLAKIEPKEATHTSHVSVNLLNQDNMEFQTKKGVMETHEFRGENTLKYNKKVFTYYLRSHEMVFQVI